MLHSFHHLRNAFLISGQRISPPNKTKTQLQICKHNEEQATFVFVNPLGKEVSFVSRYSYTLTVRCEHL